VLPFAGVILVWSGDRPRFETARVSTEGLVLGRRLIAALLGIADDRISHTHARITVADEQLAIADVGSRNGRYVHGQALLEERTVGAPYQ
jgi:FHA domain